MKILVVGASGTIGKAIVQELSPRHEVIPVGKHSGQYQVDLTQPESIRHLFEQTGMVDAIVSATGSLHFGAIATTTPKQFRIGLDDKLMGQINLVLEGQKYLTPGGSFTLTSGIINEIAIAGGSNATTVNAALEGFVRGAAADLLMKARINAVSPTVVHESLDKYGAYFRGFEAAPATRVARAYSRSIEGVETGKVYRVW